MLKISNVSVVSVNRSRELLSCDLNGEEVILDCQSGMYYGLNEIGARIWRLIEQPRVIEDIHATILEEYDVDPDRCLEDVIDLLQQLADNGLVEAALEPAPLPGDSS